MLMLNRYLAFSRDLSIPGIFFSLEQFLPQNLFLFFLFLPGKTIHFKLEKLDSVRTRLETSKFFFKIKLELLFYWPPTLTKQRCSIVGQVAAQDPGLVIPSSDETNCTQYYRIYFYIGPLSDLSSLKISRQCRTKFLNLALKTVRLYHQPGHFLMIRYRYEAKSTHK